MESIMDLERFHILAGEMAQQGYPYLDRQAAKYPLLPILAELDRDVFTLSLGRIAAEWPHADPGDPGRVLYTRNPEAGARDRVQGCSLGSYIQRVTDVPGHVVELLVRKAVTVPSTFKLLRGRKICEAMESIQHRRKGSPHSCMNYWGADQHPYRVYTSNYGWGMATRWEGDALRARALVNDESKTFVRIYGPSPSDGEYACGDDPLLRDWLSANGYSAGSSWRGKTIKLIEERGRFVMPYLDGCADYVDADSGEIVSSIDDCEDGYLESTTGGWANLMQNNSGRIEVDGDWYDEDSDEIVYSSYHDEYVLTEDSVYSEVMDSYILDSEAVAFINDIRDYRGRARYDTDYIVNTSRTRRDHSVVELYEEVDGYEYALESLTVSTPTGVFLNNNVNLVEINGEWFHAEHDEEDICFTGDRGWILAEDAVKTDDGGIIHKDDSMIPDWGAHKGRILHKDGCSAYGLYIAAKVDLPHDIRFVDVTFMDTAPLVKVVPRPKRKPRGVLCAVDPLDDTKPFFNGMRVMIAPAGFVAYHGNSANPVMTWGTVENAQPEYAQCHVKWDNGDFNSYHGREKLTVRPVTEQQYRDAVQAEPGWSDHGRAYAMAMLEGAFERHTRDVAARERSAAQSVSPMLMDYVVAAPELVDGTWDTTTVIFDEAVHA